MQTCFSFYAYRPYKEENIKGLQKADEKINKVLDNAGTKLKVREYIEIFGGTQSVKTKEFIDFDKLIMGRRKRRGEKLKNLHRSVLAFVSYAGSAGNREEALKFLDEAKKMLEKLHSDAEYQHREVEKIFHDSKTKNKQVLEKHLKGIINEMKTYWDLLKGVEQADATPVKGEKSTAFKKITIDSQKLKTRLKKPRNKTKKMLAKIPAPAKTVKSKEEDRVREDLGDLENIRNIFEKNFSPEELAENDAFKDIKKDIQMRKTRLEELRKNTKKT